MAPAAAASGSGSSRARSDGSSGSSSSSASAPPPSWLPTPALDHALSGITAGAIATVCMQPLDLIKTQFQVRTARAPRSGTAAPPAWQRWTGVGVGRDMLAAWRAIVRADGWPGLYRGLGANVVGNSASWGLYFLWYTMLKEYMAHAADGADAKVLTPGQHLLAASESGAATALLTNPIWVVKTRMFTTSRSAASASSATAAPVATASGSSSAPRAPVAYRGLAHGLRDIWRHEGVRGLYKGAGLALVGVSNGAIQFVAYEELKKWRSAVARRRGATGAEGELVKLSNAEYIVLSGVAKLFAIGLTYPYQVVRSRIQNHATAHIYPDIPTCIRRTYAQEGLRAFYKGLGPNAVRIVPGTCVTFVVYENMSWALRGAAERRSSAAPPIDVAIQQ